MLDKLEEALALTGMCMHALCCNRTLPALPLPGSAQKTSHTLTGDQRANVAVTEARAQAADQKALGPHGRTSRLHLDHRSCCHNEHVLASL